MSKTLFKVLAKIVILVLLIIIGLFAWIRIDGYKSCKCYGVTYQEVKCLGIKATCRNLNTDVIPMSIMN